MCFRIKVLILIGVWAWTGATKANETLNHLEYRYGEAQADTVKIELLLQMGDYFEHTDYESAMHFYRQALALARERIPKAQNQEHRKLLDDLEVKSLRYIAFLNKSWGEFEEAIEDYRKLQDIYHHNDNPLGLTRVLTSQGNVHYYQSAFPQALEKYLKALEIARTHDFQRQTADLLTNIASMKFLMGDFVESIDYYQQAIPIYHSIEDSHNIGIVYMGLGNIHNKMGNFNQALNNYQLALKFYDELSDHNTIANIYLSLGSLFFSHDKLNQAEEYFLKSLDHANVLNNSRMAAQAYLNLGILRAREENFADAVRYYAQGLEMARDAGNKHVEAAILRNKAIAQKRERNTAQAIQLVNLSLEIAREINSLEDQAMAYHTLSAIEEQRGRHKKALDFFKRFKTYNDSVLGNEKQKQLQELDARFQAEQKQQKIEIQKLEIDHKQAELKRKTQIVNTFVVFFVLVFILAVFLVMYYRHKKTTNKELARKDAAINEVNQKLSRQGIEIMQLKRTIEELQERSSTLTLQKQQNLEFARRVQQVMNNCTHNLLQAFKGSAFLYHGTGVDNENILCRVYHKNDMAMVVFAECNLQQIHRYILHLPLVSYLDHTIQADGFGEPLKILNGLHETCHQILRQIPDQVEEKNEFSSAVLLIDKSQNKIQYATSGIPLYLAIARNLSNVILSKEYDYQDIQQLKPETVVQPVANHARISLQELKLKKADRLYLMSMKTESGNQNGGRIIKQSTDQILQFLNDHQSAEIVNQKTILAKEVQRWKRNEEFVADLSIAGFEL